MAHSLQLRKMEWTLDQFRLRSNPLMTAEGQQEILQLSAEFDIGIPSLTGDCFMQAPFWKLRGSERSDREKDFVDIVGCCAALDIKIIVVPLVDNGQIEDSKQEDSLIGFMTEQTSLLREKDVRVAFESDFGPQKLLGLIDQFDDIFFGINYDIGNSAAMGFDPIEEIDAFGHRIINVHVKDRILGGVTVPLGEGDAQFHSVFEQLHSINYQGNFILQTARADDGDHVGALDRYASMVKSWA